ncbi:MAG: tail fiber domain-containing protein, partial [Bdellovibrionales bacterium]|nr:tail fiber domain-containing protein [Bdellovibrionales bacterium]
VSNGGTGLALVPTNGQILIGNGTNYSLAGILGTANRVTVTNGAGTITLSGPQDLHTGATPTFAGLTSPTLTSVAGLGLTSAANQNITVNAQGTGSVNLQTAGTTRLTASATGAAVTGALSATTSITTGSNGGTGGSLILNGATSGALTLNVPAAITSYTYTWPSAAPGTPATMFLRGDGTWAVPSGGGGTTTNAVTFNNGGAGAASGTTFDGSAARTISYNSIGAVGGSGTTNTVPRFASANTLADSGITDNGTTIGLARNTSVTGVLTTTDSIQLGTASNRGLSITENYMSLGESEGGATTILGNNIRVTDGVGSTVQVSANAADGSNWLGINYSRGFTFNRVGPTAVGTQMLETSGELMRITTVGDVGIGTSSPIRKLSLNGEFSMLTAGTAYFNVSDGVGNSGGSMNLRIRGLGSNGSAEVAMNSIVLNAVTTNAAGNLTVGGSITSSGGISATGHLDPAAANTYDVGSAYAQRWRTVRVGDSLQQLDGYDFTELAQNSWGGSHGILFGAYKKSSQIAGDLFTTGNTAYYAGPGSYSYGAGGIRFLANGGQMDFMISPVSTGANNDVAWTSILSLTRGGGASVLGNLSASGNISIGRYLTMNGKEAIDANDSWLRLNQSGSFASGTYTPGYFRADGGMTVGGIGSPGAGNLNIQGSITSVGDILATNNYGLGLVGVYSDTRYQNVFAMGPAYRLSADGTSAGNMYGIAWTHSNIGGQSKAGLGHQMLIMENGVTRTALGTGVWTNANMTASAYNYHFGVGLSNNGTDSWIRASGPIWGNANTLATDGCISAGRGGSCTGAGAVDSTNWFRSYGATGWYNQSYAGGWYMDDTFDVKVYNNKNIRTAGSVIAGAYYHTSDQRLKKDIQTFENPLQTIESLRGVRFKWKESGLSEIGFIAQEVEKVDPTLVMTGHDPQKTKAVKYSNITAILVEGVKEIRKSLGLFATRDEVSVLRAENQDLKKKISDLENRFNQLENGSRRPAKQNN